MLNKLQNFSNRLRGNTSAAKNDEPGDAPHCVHTVAILHIDIVDSTELVRQNMVLAHRQILQLYDRIRQICHLHRGVARELRGDAAVVEFISADDAVGAALAIHSAMALMNSTRMGHINPKIRTGISFGPVISDKQIITGEPVIMAQRMEQLAEPGSVVFDQSVFERLFHKEALLLTSLGRKRVKGFADPVQVYEASRLNSHALHELNSHFQALSLQR